MTNICGTCLSRAMSEIQECRRCGLLVCYHIMKSDEHRCPGSAAPAPERSPAASPRQQPQVEVSRKPARPAAAPLKEAP